VHQIVPWIVIADTLILTPEVSLSPSTSHDLHRSIIIDRLEASELKQPCSWGRSLSELYRWKKAQKGHDAMVQHAKTTIRQKLSPTAAAMKRSVPLRSFAGASGKIS
jgi:hypothetical protein